ncbi:ABC transporter permease [Nannocystis bainbridge]|uniref:ABC-2 family transporter protein n=1 Tax=Nannocystis bainbridge TaxID=2995303 RepID=A0ABT5E3M0_9BACT|nr:ABC-2 family transporter protein [Nannocystis bainbridge]MDC0720028.1 ABC-2 family transporter protein [Nannocystis bainbridge]
MFQRAGHLTRVMAAVWRISLAEAIAYRVSMLMWVLTTTFPLVSLSLWSGLAASGPIGDYARPDFVAYFVAAFLVRQFTASWVVWELSAQIRSGDLNTLLMRPMSPMLYHAIQNLAALPIRCALALPIGVLVLTLTGGLGWPSPGSLLALGLSLTLAWLLNLGVHVTIGCVAFWVTESTALFEVWLGLYLVLSGAAVPTSLYPAGLAEVIRALPFHASLGFPVELAIGRATGAAVTHGLLLQALWVAVFGALATVLWRRGVRAYEGVGA